MKIIFPLLLSIPFLSWETSLLLFLGLFSSYFLFITTNTLLSFNIIRNIVNSNLILLTLFIICLIKISLSSFLKESKAKQFYYLTIWIMSIFLIFFFRRKSRIRFYIFFERGMIPIFFLIIGWGLNQERLQAGLFMFFYTFSFSLPFLLFILYFKSNNLNEGLSSLIGGVKERKTILSLIISLVFLVKIPIFIVHLWLPKAHVEAPVTGSIILAGVLLKIGGYGLISFLVLHYSFFAHSKFFFVIYGLIGRLIIRFICLRQVDLKCLIAYSSVAHIGIVIYAIYFGTYWSLWGAVAIMIAHGLSSSGIFFALNIYYERFFSRRSLILKGGAFFIPLFLLWWFLLCIGRISSPPSLNFFSEIFILINIIGAIDLNPFIFVIIIFLSGVYSVILYILLGHGKRIRVSFISNFPVRDSLIFSSHVVPIYFFLLSGIKFLA